MLEKKRCWEKAEQGDGAFAIAFAILDAADRIAAAADRQAAALRMLGTADAAAPMGAMEYLGTQIEKAGALIADALQHQDLHVMAPVHIDGCSSQRKPDA